MWLPAELQTVLGGLLETHRANWHARLNDTYFMNVETALSVAARHRRVHRTLRI